MDEINLKTAYVVLGEMVESARLGKRDRVLKLSDCFNRALSDEENTSLLRAYDNCRQSCIWSVNGNDELRPEFISDAILRYGKLDNPLGE